MNIYTDISEIKNKKDSIVTVGTFDGVHLGHAEVLKFLVRKTAESGRIGYVVTFDPHPRKVVFTVENVMVLTTLDEKIEILNSLGIENLVVIKFNREFSKLNSQEFVKKYLIDGLNAKSIVIGHDHRFGKDRGGDENSLLELGEKYDFDIKAFSPITLNDNVVSSTKIRKTLSSGQLELANSLLGRNYSLNGIVIKGAGRGRFLGFPTANITVVDDSKLIPFNGVYAVKCCIKNRTHNGILNIGYRPTFEDEHELVIETHIFDFSRDIYGEEIKIEFLSYLRNEIKFNSKNELISQIENDKNEALNFISKLNN